MSKIKLHCKAETKVLHKYVENSLLDRKYGFLWVLWKWHCKTQSKVLHDYVGEWYCKAETTVLHYYIEIKNCKAEGQNYKFIKNFGI